MEWETVIGLEVHTQLATHSKIFSGSSVAYGAEANTQASLVDLGMPGTLPVLNKHAVELAVRLGLAIGAKITQHSVFARKNYFYPDLPKGYQISQYELPIVAHGHLEIDLEDGQTKTIFIERAHLEEDAGKSLHEDFQGQTGIDLNRAGTPLLEIVTAPDMRSAKEAVAYLKALHALVRYLGISDGNMQEGSFRCDANVSVRPKGQAEYGTRAEIKNLNSFRFIEQAINHEVERQIELIESGGKVRQETRLYDPDRGETRSMRSKEDANDYRYFPDPDLLPVEISSTQIEQIRAELPELPRAKKQRFTKDYTLNPSDIEILVSSRALADYFEAVAQKTADVRLASSWVLGTVNALLNKDGLDISAAPVSAALLSDILLRVKDSTITTKAAKILLDHFWSGTKTGSVDALIVELDLKQANDDGAITAIIDEIIANNPAQVAEYRSGKEKVFAFFVGQTMRAAKGKANPNTVNDLLKKKLES